MRRRDFEIKYKYLFIIGGILLGALIVYIIVLAGRNMLVEVTKLPFINSQEYCFTGTGFLYIDNSTVNYIDLDGDGYPAILNNKDVHIAGSGKNMHVVYDKASVSIIGNEEASLVDGELISVKCCKDYVACLVNKSGSEHIELFNIKGKLIETIEQPMKVTDFGFTGTKKQQLYTISVEMAAEHFVSTVTTYDPSQGATTGVITVQNQLIESITFGEKSTFIKGTENIIRYDSETNKECYRLVANGYTMEDCTISTENAYIMLRAGDSEKGALKMYRTALKTVSSVGILPLYKQKDDLCTFFYADSIYSFSSNSLKRYSTAGKFREEEKLSVSATNITRLSDNLVLIEAGSGLYVAKIEPNNAVKKTFIR